MKPAIRFPDPQRATRDLLRAALSGRSEPEALGATVSTRLPASGASLPYVTVRSDGRTRDARLNGRATIRVSVWHRDEGLGEDLASLCEALLLSARSRTIRSVAPVTGPTPTTDPDTGEPLSFFTVTAYLKPEQLSD